MQRLSSTDLGRTTTGIVMDALQLETTAPVNLGGNGLDVYYITLQSTRGGPASTGTMSVFDTSGPHLAVESFNIDVFFDIRKGSLSGPIVLSSDVALLGSTDAWLHACRPTPY